MPNFQKKLWSGFVYSILAFYTWKMLILTLPYLNINEVVDFLRIKRSAFQVPFWRIAFYVHVLTSMFLLLAGFTQFNSHIQKKYLNLHRWVGRLYVVIILGLSGPAGFVMALYANGGVVSKVAFGLLAVLWWTFTFIAYRAIREGAVEKHKVFMWRSFALTLSAITLRALKVVIVWAFEPPPMDVYRMVAWLGWVPNLLLVEWWLWKQRNKNETSRFF